MISKEIKEVTVFNPILYYVTVSPVETSPCNPSPCGINAHCEEKGSHQAICSCIQDYVGDPYVQCRPECVEDSNCPYHLACMAGKCKDPCPGSCGRRAECQVINHVPSCYCPERYTGDPFSSCRQIVNDPRKLNRDIEFM